jgi:putative ABC transport system permease protein
VGICRGGRVGAGHRRDDHQPAGAPHRNGKPREKSADGVKRASQLKTKTAFMIRNYFKIAWRNLQRNKLYSAINIFGLAVGLAVGFVLLYWVNNEYTMNGFHKNADRIYEINARLKFGTDIAVWQNVPAPVALYAREHIPDIEKIVRIKHGYGNNQVVKANGKIFVESNYAYTENEFFNVFDFHIVQGSADDPFGKGLTAILSESIARKYFGNEDPIGKIIRFRDTTVQVSAVMEDMPANSSLAYDILFSLEVQKAKFRGNGQWRTIDQDWGNYDYNTFCLLKKDGDTAHASKIIRDALLKVYKESTTSFPFRPLKTIYLYNADGSRGRIVMVEIFLVVGIFILLIAAINYVNLVTARATQRIKEISMRKILGAEKRQLFIQFFFETALLILLSVLAALVLVQLILPVHSQVTGTHLRVNLLNWQLWKVLLLLVLGIWVLSGLYPALLLSSFRPVRALRGTGIFSNTGLVRKTLVVLQFVVSISLILGTVFIHRQMNFMLHSDLKLNTDQVLAFTTWRLPGSGAEEFASQVKKIAGVTGAAESNGSLFEGVNTTTDIDWTGKPKDTEMWIAQWQVDRNFLSFFDLKLKEGQNFDNVSINSPAWILNETAVKKMGLINPVGQSIKFHEKTGTILGVVNDFHFESMRRELMPAILDYNDEALGTLYIRVQPQHAGKAIAAAEAVWKKYEPNLPMEFHFLNDQIAKEYDYESKASGLFDAFAIITMLISCLGLFGLTTYSAERRVKEIGIRKVLGAGVTRIAVLLSTEFVSLVIIATLIAIPIVWYGMTRMLENYAYRLPLSWWVFAIAAIGAIALAILTMSFQAVRSGLSNPVKSLRTE